MQNIALTLRYAGTEFHGWQRQESLRTVQGTLEAALERVLKQRVSVIGCGRTDAGVHAECYVANFRCANCSVPMERLPLALNSNLPNDIAVSSAWYVPPDFHSVFSCTRKEYTYRVHNSPTRDPLINNRVWWYHQPLNLERIAAGAKEFIGTHDFAAMRSVGTNVKTTVRTIFSFDIWENRGIINMRVAANGFLYNMVRAMVGTLIYVSLGKLEPPDIRRVLDSGNRTLGGPTAPPQGLYMTGVEYENFNVREI
ncbi:MAG: tRNA pseudouridine(38-40) synthase TruA [Oscillospiraceae bacterium]|jgi:tRNA pseudouridine38-40 synthase|nr:tRNA pseudouridine(38-40) synthase TruA [Oscillospiraceae bacterium]